MPKAKKTSTKTAIMDGQTASILGIGVSSSPKHQLLKRVTGWMTEKRQRSQLIKLIYTPNPEMMADAWEDREFKRVLQGADLNIPDGIGLVWGGVLRKMTGRQGWTISNRVSGADLAEDLVKYAKGQGLKVFFLGGKSSVADEAAEIFRRGGSGKGFEIMAEAGPERLGEADKREDDRLVKMINEFEPDLLLVAFGHKKQEKWLDKHRERLNVKVGMGVGGTFDYWAGRVARAPRVWQNLGLEWLWRLYKEPWRWRRQLKLLKFIRLVVR